MGFVTTSIGLAQVLAPVLGGLVYEKSGYDAVFGISFGLIGLDLVLRLIMIERRDALTWQSTGAVFPDTAAQAQQEASTEQTRTTIASTGAVNTSFNMSLDVDSVRPTILDSIMVFRLLRMPAMLAALWGLCVLIALLTAFDSVIYQSINPLLMYSKLADLS